MSWITTPRMFLSESLTATPATEGDPASPSVTFEAFPRPDAEAGEVYWLLETPKDPALRLPLGQEAQRFRARELEDLGGNRWGGLGVGTATGPC